MMRILYVWDADYPWDVRTEKICLSLTQDGHQVVIAARNRQGLPRSETRPEGVVERLPPFRFPGGDYLSFPAFFNPFWLGHLRKLHRRHRIDLVIVRDLPLAPTALLTFRGRCPVILDMAENYPAMIADIWDDGRAHPWDFVVRNPRIVAAIERHALRRVTHVLTVVEESQARLLRLGVPAERVSVVSNTPPLSRITELARRSESDPLRVVYLGLMETHRGVTQLLEAAKLLTDAGIALRLDLVGDGRDHDAYRAHAARLGMRAPALVFHGRLRHEQAIEVVTRSHIGVVPHHARESWNTTIPNKLFDYMAAGLAVVSSDAVPAARIIAETGAGLVFRGVNATDLAAKLRMLLDLSSWDRCRHNGQQAVRTRYNWEADSAVLLSVASRLQQRILRGQRTA